jgi:hypothetical protein
LFLGEYLRLERESIKMTGIEDGGHVSTDSYQNLGCKKKMERKEE